MTYHYECRRCGHKFDEPRIASVKYMDIRSYSICPSCKHWDIVPILCAYCDFYKRRDFPCERGHTTITPFNVSCGEWNIRSKDKPKVL